VWGILPVKNRKWQKWTEQTINKRPMVADNDFFSTPPASPAQRRHAERAGRAAHGVLAGPNAGIAQDAAALADDISDDDGGRAGPEADGRRRRTRGTSARGAQAHARVCWPNETRDARGQKAAAPPAPRMTPLARPRPARPNRRGARERGGGARRRRPAQERRGLRVQTRPLVRRYRGRPAARAEPAAARAGGDSVHAHGGAADAGVRRRRGSVESRRAGHAR